MNSETDIVTVENLMPHLKQSYGQIQRVGRDKAERGRMLGIYRIVKDPIDADRISVVTQINTSAKTGNLLSGLVSIVILTMNQFFYTQKCIDSILKNTDSEQFQLIMIDNNSTDNTIEWLRKKLRPQDILVSNKYNRGFSAGCNQGLKIANGEYILFLNNDIEVLLPGWLDPLYNGAKNADIVGPTMGKLHVDKKHHMFIYAGEGSSKDQYHYIEGWCVFGKKSIFEYVGGFDERFSPAYSEDSDLSMIAQNKGLRLLKVENPKLKHFKNRTSQAMGTAVHTISSRNRKKLYNKWFGGGIEKILLNRQGARGDVLMCTPIFKALKEKHPAADITLITHSPELIQNNPYIKNIVNGIPHQKYDIDVTIEYEKTPGQIRIDSMAEQAGVTLSSRKMEVFFEPVKIPKYDKYIVVHTGMSWPNRMWPLIAWKMLCQKIIKKYKYNIVFVGDKHTKLPGLKCNEIIDNRNKSWAYVASLLKGARFFIGIDSAVSNLAKAVNTRAYIFYGCVNPAVMIADADEIPLIDNTLDCFGCRDKSSAIYVECTQKEPYCLTNITPDMVIKKIQETEKEKIDAC